MIDIKTKEEIEIMRVGGKILAEVLGEVLEYVEPGVSELELDALAEELIREKGAEPAFKKVKGYRYSICVSTNDVVVHGIPTNYRFKEGDVVGADCGVYYKGFNTDMAETLCVSTQNSRLAAKRAKLSPRGEAGKTQNSEKEKFLRTGKRALGEAIKVARVGNRIGDISETIQDIVEGSGYCVVRSLVGHGVGRQLHEEPEVPGFLATKVENTPRLREGMTIAIEVIYNIGKADVVYANGDGWTIKTKDGSLSGLFERTIVVTKDGPLVLTQA
jgi:methionyl aminopeptidase